MAWAWEQLDAARLISLIEPGNARSIRVASRLGMGELGETTLGEATVTVYGIERPDLPAPPRAHRGLG
jgi:RimJ/RimL family protein N-acetyltransferase